MDNITQPGFQIWWKAPSHCCPDEIHARDHIASFSRTFRRRSASESLNRACTELAKELNSSGQRVFSRLDTSARRPTRRFYVEHTFTGVVKYAFAVCVTRINDSERVTVCHWQSDDVGTPVCRTPLHKIETIVNNSFDLYRRTCSSRTINSAIDSFIRYDMNGHQIPGLNAYFVPPESISKWKKVEQVLTESNQRAGERTCFSAVEFKMTGDVLEDMKQSIDSELADEIATLTAAVNESDLSTKVGKQKAEQLAKCQAKMKRYREMFSDGVKYCDTQLQAVAAPANVAAAAARPDSPIDELFSV